MDAIEYLKAAKRMCKSYEKCEDCPLVYTGTAFPCKGVDFSPEIAAPQNLVDIIEKWAAEHPGKTRQSEFLKMFPNPKYYFGVIDICPQGVEYGYEPEEGCEETICYECKKAYWLAEVE